MTLIPIKTVDRAVNLIRRHGTPDEKAALSRAVNLLRTEGRNAQRAAIVAVAEQLRARREKSGGSETGARYACGSAFATLT